MALWGGRFEAGVAEITQEFGASLPVDKHLYKQDIAGSKAHAKMLAAQGIISAEDEQAIAEGLSGIEQDIDAGNFTFDINDEDIHTVDQLKQLIAFHKEFRALASDAGDVFERLSIFTTNAIKE